MKHNFFTISRNFALLSVALMLFSAVKPCIVSAQQLIVNLAPRVSGVE